VEEALFITEPIDLVDLPDRYKRIYFGNEFCQRLIPADKELNQVLDITLSKGLQFTFVTGFVTDAALDYLKDLLAIISGRDPKAEVVINDWGMLNAVKEHNLTPVIGRLLTKQKRDPRMVNLPRRLPQKAVECSKASGISQYLIRFLKDNSVERLEIDNLPQSIRISDYVKAGITHLSMYFPFNYVTTSRQCLFDNGYCQKKCRHNTIILKHRTMPLPLQLKGNTIFVENRQMPDSLTLDKIDRIVYQQITPEQTKP